jgi:hypothetical protein
MYLSIAFGQATIEIPFTVTDGNGVSQELIFGLDPTATPGIDPTLGEVEQPPLPPAGVFDARFVSNLQSTLGEGTLVDIRNAATFPFSGSYTHQIKYQTSDIPNPTTIITISWNLPPEIVSGSVIRDLLGGILINEPFVGTGSVTVANAAVINQLEIVVNYSNIAPAGGLTITPASFDFGLVAVGGGSSTLQATLTNTSTNPLDVTGINISDPQFSQSGPAIPFTIGPGLSTVVNITFAPTVLGLTTASIEFINTAPGSPAVLNVQGTGAEAGPTFVVNPTSLNFGNVGVGTSSTLNVTVSNNGLTNPLVISSASTSPPQYTITPTSATISPAGNQVFQVTFTPTVAGTVPGTLTFVHNAPGSPSSVSLTGNGIATFGLIFKNDTTTRLEDFSYIDTLQLIDVNFGPLGADKIQALQFRLLVNKSLGDETILTFQSLAKGSNVSDPNWILNYNVVRGPIQGNGASQDEIYVLLYNLQADSGLAAGDYLDLLRVTYRVADLPALLDLVPSTFQITNAEASTTLGNPINITPSRDKFVVLAKNRVSDRGDVNGDGCLDILDLILVVDHIIGVDSLDAAEFARADIAPWTTGAAEPIPDSVVNVQDLSLIQNIILTGFFPDGTPVGPCNFAILPKITDADAKVTFYISNEGITAYLESNIAIRGAQIEFNNLSSDPSGMVINTDLGQGFYLKVEELLRTLMYDRLGEKFVESGTDKFIADMPFYIAEPEDLTLENLILVDIDKNKIGKLQVEIIYGNAPSIPLDYVLFQNFPNPFNPNTTVKFQVPTTSDVTVKIFDMLGQEVRTLFAGEVQRGTYSVNWDGLNNFGVQMSSGTYIYRMIAGEFVQSKKMILIK